MRALLALELQKNPRPLGPELNPKPAKALCGCSTFGLGPHLANVVATDITDLTLFFCSFRFRVYLVWKGGGFKSVLGRRSTKLQLRVSTALVHMFYSV